MFVSDEPVFVLQNYFHEIPFSHWCFHPSATHSSRIHGNSQVFQLQATEETAITDSGERAFVKGVADTRDKKAKKAAETGRTISKNKEVWAAAGVRAKITVQHVAGGDRRCHHHSTQNTSAYTSRSMALDSGPPTTTSAVALGTHDVTAVPVIVIRMDSAPTLLCITRALSSKPGADPSGLRNLAYVSCSSCRQGWASKELTFFFLNSIL